MAYSPPPGSYEKEHRLSFIAADPSWTFAVFSGSVNGSFIFAGKTDDDSVYTYNQMELIVGPWWKDVRKVVPFVTISGYDNSDADDDDEQGWSIQELTWDTVGGTGPNIDEERIRLKFAVRLKGMNTRLTRVGYYVTAGGRELGAGGIDKP